MSPALTVCKAKTCPNLTPSGYCTTCARAADRARGSRQARGYDRDHDRLRAQLQARLDGGQQLECTNPVCVEPTRTIRPGDLWDLGHDGARRHRGPEHRRCNRSAGGKAAHAEPGN